ncbi:Rap-GAP domain-containing protein [Entamoeba marina]
MIPSPLNENPIISTTGGILKEYPQSPLLLFNSKSRVDVVVETINCIYTDPDIENKMNTTSKFNWFLEVLAATSYLGKESSPFKISTLKLYSKWLLTDVKPQPLKNNFEEYADYILYCLINYFNLKDDDHDVQPTNCYHSLHIIDNVIHETQIETVRLSCIRSLILIIDLLTESCPFESMFGRVLNVLHQAIMLCNVSDATMELFFLRSKSWGHNLDAARQWFSTCVALQTGYISYLEQKTDDVIVNFLMKNGETTPLILEPKRALQMWFSSLIHLMVDLSFDETYKFEKPDGNAIFMLYGNFLFHVITRAESKLCYDAVASAVAGLSSFFASMITKTTFDIKYVSYLTVALNRTLRSENNNIVYSCISHINKLLLYPIGPISLILEPLLKSINHLVECGFPTTPVIYGVLIKTLQDSLLPFSITQKLQFIPLYNSIIRRLVNRDLLSPDNFPALFQFIENYLAISLPIKQTSSTLNLASIKNSNITDCPTIHHIVWALLFDSNILLDVSFRNSKEKPIRAIVSLFRIIKDYLGFVLESTEFVLKTVDLFFEFLTNFVNSDKIISIALIVEVLHLTMGYSLLIQNQDITQRLVTILIKLHFNKNIDVRYVDFFASTFINHLCSHQLTTESEVLEKLKESGVEDPMKYLHVGVFNESIISFIDHPYKTDAHYTTVIIRHLYGKRVFSFKTSNNAHVCSFTQFSPCYESFQQRLRWVIQNVSSSFFDYSSDISLDNYASMEEKFY